MQPTKDNTRRRAEHGFTLIETSVAMVVMLVVGLAAASLFTWAVTYNTGAAGRDLATLLAQQRMERLRTIPFDADTRDLALGSGGLAATAAAGVTEASVPSGGQLFDVTTTIVDIADDAAGAPVIKRITVSVMPTGAAPALGGVTLVTLRATSVKGTN